MAKCDQKSCATSDENSDRIVDSVVDSGATHVMTGRRDLFSKISSKIKITLRRTKRHGVSDVSRRVLQNNNLGVRFALFHPHLSVTLISVSVLENMGHKIIFDGPARRIEMLYMGRFFRWFWTKIGSTQTGSRLLST